MNLIVLATLFVSLNGMRYKMDQDFLGRYARDSGISVQVLLLGILSQFVAAAFFVSSYWWPTGRTIGFLLDLPSCLSGVYVSGMKAMTTNPTQTEISFFNLQVIMTAITVHYLFNRL